MSGNPRELAQVKSSGEDMYALCSFLIGRGGSWMDCDVFGETGCPGAVGYCGSDVCGSSGGVPKASNVQVGDYSDWSGDTNYQCCGDDFGEKYVDTMRDNKPVSAQGIIREDCDDITVQGFCCQAVHNSVVKDTEGNYYCSEDAPDQSLTDTCIITNNPGCTVNSDCCFYPDDYCDIEDGETEGICRESGSDACKYAWPAEGSLLSPVTVCCELPHGEPPIYWTEEVFIVSYD